MGRKHIVPYGLYVAHGFISAKFAEKGGADLIIIYNSGRYRMAGRGSLAGLMPYGNANEIVKDMAREVLTAVKHTPVLAGVCATDPFLLRDQFLRELKSMGFAGIQNFPTVGLIDGVFRQNLEETGMSYALEVECVRAARALDLLTTPYVFCEADARAMAGAGADIVVCHLGLTTGGAIGAETSLELADCVAPINAWAAAAKAVNPDVIVLCHGGPIATPDIIHFTDGLPKTRSGKIMRRILRKIAENEFGALGDTSTLADPSLVERLIEGRQNR